MEGCGGGDAGTQHTSPSRRILRPLFDFFFQFSTFFRFRFHHPPQRQPPRSIRRRQRESSGTSRTTHALKGRRGGIRNESRTMGTRNETEVTTAQGISQVHKGGEAERGEAGWLLSAVSMGDEGGGFCGGPKQATAHSASLTPHHPVCSKGTNINFSPSRAHRDAT